MADALTTDPRAVPAQGSLHTPGPWKLNWTIAGGGCLEDYPELQYVNIHSDRYFDVAPNGLSLTGYMRPADAHLIAAAPDLLVLARQYANECAECGGIGRLEADGDPSRVATEPCSECADIRAVIAKATGEKTSAARRELCLKEVHPGSPSLNDKGHDGECDDIPY